jgi:hypothetical protein
MDAPWLRGSTVPANRILANKKDVITVSFPKLDNTVLFL